MGVAGGGSSRDQEGRKHSPGALALLTAAGFAISYAGRFLGGSDSVSDPVVALVTLGGIVLIVMAACFAAADWMRVSDRTWQRDRSSS